MRAWIIAAALLLPFPHPAVPALIETEQAGVSTIRVNFAIVAEDSAATIDDRVSVFAIFGGPTTPEVRTAARSSFTGELAANVRMDDKSEFSFTPVETISSATLIVHVAPDSVFVRRAELDFFLPPSFLEVTSNAELPGNALEMSILADLRVCFATFCGGGDSQFNFQSRLTASWLSFTEFSSATGNASLDLTPLQNPTVTEVSGPLDFLRTVTLDFPAFQGHLDLGLIPPGLPLRVEYQMQARGEGVLAHNIGLSAINDPFLLSTDPVSPGVAMTLALGPPTTVPGPATLILLMAGLGVTAARIRRR